MKQISIFSLILLLLIFTVQKATSQNQILRERLDSLTRLHHATIGIGIIHIESGDTMTLNNSHLFPMQSVYKVPLALAVLREVDTQRFKLTQKFHISKSDLLPNTWSPLRDKYPDGEIELTLYELLEYMVSNSDNNVCDFLFRLMGGTIIVENYIHRLGFSDIKIAATEEEMHQNFDIQYTNTTTPFEMTALLQNIFQSKQQTKLSRDCIMWLMKNSSNSNNRLKGLLPAVTEVAHKTGTSGSNEKGMTAAVNDVGIITLPDQNHIAISVFVSDSMEPFESNERIIAQISKMVYDFYTN